MVQEKVQSTLDSVLKEDIDQGFSTWGPCMEFREHRNSAKLHIKL